jgi:hypothetical protein
MPFQPVMTAAPPGFEPVPARVLTDIETLPCDLYIWRGPRPVLYAMRGGDLRRVVARAQRGMSFLVRDIDADLLHGALAESLPRVLENQRISPIERSKTAYSIAAKVLAPIFMRDRPLDHDGLILTQTAIDSDHDADARRRGPGVGDGRDDAEAHGDAHTRHQLRRLRHRSGPFCTYRRARRDPRTWPAGASSTTSARTACQRPSSTSPGLARRPRMAGDARPRKAGYDMIVRALGYAPSYAHIIAEHHERCDGSGYPASRLPHQIALDSQVVAIVDAFDALTSRRPYKAAVTHLRRPAPDARGDARPVQRRAAPRVHQAAGRLERPERRERLGREVAN